MTVIYEDARAWAEDRAAELEYHAKKHPADHGAVRDAARFRSLLAGPPEPSEDEVARVIARHNYGPHLAPFLSDFAAAAEVQALYRSRRNG